MSQELHYTSVPRGLKPGSRGFCTVATTPNLSRPLAERLEGLSGYQPVYPPGDPSAALNPVVHAHVKVSIAGRPLHVLSRIGPAGLDYSSRPNKYAHHVVLELGEGPQAGPAWLLRQAGFMETAWIGEPRMLSGGRLPPQGDRPPTLALAWQACTGDPGWAGVLAEAFLADPRRPAYLVFRPGTQLLPLFEEAIALLPPSRRWDVEFSTYFTHLPQGISCSWRGVLDGSEEAGQAARLPGALLIDLCGTPGRAQGSALVQLARTGERVDLPNASTAAHPLVEPSLDTIPPLPSSHGQRASLPSASPGGIDLIPEMAALMTPKRSRAFSADSMRPPRGRKQVGILVASLVILPLLALAGAVYVISKSRGERETGRPRMATSQESTPVIGARVEAPRIPRSPAKTEAARREFERGIRSKPAAEKSNQVALATGPTNAVAKPPPPPADLPPTPPTPKTPVAPPKEPLARFFPIASSPFLGLGPEDMEEHLFPLEKDIDSVEILNANDKKLDVQRSGGRELTILTKSKSKAFDPVEVAKLKYGKREVSFDWGQNIQNETETASDVLDTVLNIHFADGEAQYVLLRDPGVRKERGALTLLEPSGRGPKARSWSTNWAAKDGLKATKRQFLIRRWQVARKSQDQHASFVAGSRAGAGPTADDEQPIISDDATLKITIGSHDPWNIYVGFELSPRLKENLTRLQTRITELELRYFFGDSRGDLGERAQRLRRKLDEEVKYLRRLDDRSIDLQDRQINDEIRRSKLDMADLEKSLEGARSYFLLGERVRAGRDSKLELSVIVCLELESGTVVDVARFGEFATPQP